MCDTKSGQSPERHCHRSNVKGLLCIDDIAFRFGGAWVHSEVFLCRWSRRIPAKSVPVDQLTIARPKWNSTDDGNEADQPRLGSGTLCMEGAPCNFFSTVWRFAHIVLLLNCQQRWISSFPGKEGAVWRRLGAVRKGYWNLVVNPERQVLKVLLRSMSVFRSASACFGVAVKFVKQILSLCCRRTRPGQEGKPAKKGEYLSMRVNCLFLVFNEVALWHSPIR